MEAEQAYLQLKAKFFGIEFTDGIIRIHILESVQEHLEEGTAMHHCVYDAHYYSKPQSLIFSATKDGERIETIEVSLGNNESGCKVVECTTRTLSTTSRYSLDAEEYEDDRAESKPHNNPLKQGNMKVQVEGIICNWADEIPNVIVRVINAISIAENKGGDCRPHSSKSPKKTELDKFFVSWLRSRITLGSLIAGYRMASRWNTDYSLLNFENMERKVYRVRTQYVLKVCLR